MPLHDVNSTNQESTQETTRPSNSEVNTSKNPFSVIHRSLSKKWRLNRTRSYQSASTLVNSIDSYSHLEGNLRSNTPPAKVSESQTITCMFQPPSELTDVLGMPIHNNRMGIPYVSYGVCNVCFHVPADFRIRDIKGQGAYGIVCDVSHEPFDFPDAKSMTMSTIYEEERRQLESSHSMHHNKTSKTKQQSSSSCSLCQLEECQLFNSVNIYQTTTSRHRPQKNKLSNFYAIKKIENTFECLNYAKRTLRELIILRLLDHPHICKIDKVYIIGDKQNFDDIYVMTSLLETDLATILKSDQTISLNFVRNTMGQVLSACEYLHGMGIVHRDLKPRNIVINSNGFLKICDFGLARAFIPFSDGELVTDYTVTEYVCTRWYRPPEILCGVLGLDASLDIWSIGAIFIELFIRKPLFAGRNTQHQLKLIVDTIGLPDDTRLQKTMPLLPTKCREYLIKLNSSLGGNHQDGYDPFETICPTGYVEFGIKEVIDKTLKFIPIERYSSSELLKLKFFKGFKSSSLNNPSGPIDMTEFEFERRKIDEYGLRELLYREMAIYYPKEAIRNSISSLFDTKYSTIERYRLLRPDEEQFSDVETS